jgi:GT2 family glycosyltransferase
MNIDAVVVTRNRITQLKKTIESLNNQTLKLRNIYVVDNYSDDGTREWISVQRGLNPIFLEKNLGGAGGFHYGIKKAYESSAEWIWIMDDDCIPNSDALEELVKSRMFEPKPIFDETGFLASAVNWINGERCRMNIPQPAWEWNWFHNEYPGCYRLNAASFVSILINAKAVKKVGLPVKEFFIWYDDWEYTKRITREFPAFYVKSSTVIHETRENTGVDYNSIDQNNLWKYKYGVRNEVAIIREEEGFFTAILLIIKKTQQLSILKKPASLIISIICSGINGLTFNYKKYIIKL